MKNEKEFKKSKIFKKGFILAMVIGPFICYVTLMFFFISPFKSQDKQHYKEFFFPALCYNILFQFREALLPVQMEVDFIAKEDGLLNLVEQENFDSHNLKNYLSLYSQKFNFFEAGYVSFFNDHFYSSRGDDFVLDRNNIARDSWYFLFKDHSLSKSFDYWYFSKEDITTLYYNSLVYDRSGKPTGLIGASADIQNFRSLFEENQSLIKNNYDYDLYFIRLDGKIAFNSNYSELNNKKNQICDIAPLQVDDLPYKQSHPFLLEYTDDQGDKRVFYLWYAPSIETVIGLNFYSNQLFASINETLFRQILLTIILCFLFVGISLLGVRYYFRYIAYQNSFLEKQITLQKTLIRIFTHDTATPLSCLINQSKDLLSKEAEGSTIIYTASQSIRNISANAVTLLELQEKKRDRSIEDICDIGELLEEGKPYFDSIAKNKRILLNYNFELEDSYYVYGAKGLVQSAINNLIDNAIKYTLYGGVILINLVEEESCYALSIIDGGPGISDFDYPYLFQKFQPLSATPSGGESSTGLGLYLVKEIATLYGGSIQCLQRKLGAEFILKLKKEV